MSAWKPQRIRAIDHFQQAGPCVFQLWHAAPADFAFGSESFSHDRRRCRRPVLKVSRDFLPDCLRDRPTQSLTPAAESRRTTPVGDERPVRAVFRAMVQPLRTCSRNWPRFFFAPHSGSTHRWGGQTGATTETDDQVATLNFFRPVVSNRHRRSRY